MNKNSLGKRGFISSYSPRVTVLTEEMKWRPWRSVASWLDSLGLFNLFSYTVKNYMPRSYIAPSELGIPISIA